MSKKPKYACPNCGEIEFVTLPNSHDRYMAMEDRLCWQKTELSGHNDFQLYCHCCGDRAPEEYENAAG